VSLPFHIQKMSTLDAAATLRWTGWILGISPLITVITAPISGRIGERIDPKRGFMAVQAFQGLGFSAWRSRARCPRCWSPACSWG